MSRLTDEELDAAEEQIESVHNLSVALGGGRSFPFIPKGSDKHVEFSIAISLKRIAGTLEELLIVLRSK